MHVNYTLCGPTPAPHHTPKANIPNVLETQGPNCQFCSPAKILDEVLWCTVGNEGVKRIPEVSTICHLIWYIYAERKLNGSFGGWQWLPGDTLTFNNHHTGRLICAVVVGRNALILSGVLRSAVDNLHGNHTIRVTHGIVKLGKFLVTLEPLDSRNRLAGETTEKLAGLVALDDARTQEEGEAGCTLAFLLPHLVGEWLAAAHDLLLGPVLRDLWGQGCGRGSYGMVGMAAVEY